MGQLGPLYIVGAGRMAHEALDIYRALGREREVTGFVVDDDFVGRAATAARPVLPVVPWSKVAGDARRCRFLGAIGSVQRRGIVGRIEQAGGSFDTLVHPSVQQSGSVKIEPGAILMAGVVCTIEVAIGAHTIVNIGCTLSHDVRIGRLVTLSPGVHVAGCSTIEDEAFLGVGASVVDRVTVGKGAVIGAGAVVIRDIPAGVTAVGVPAKPVAR